MAKATGGVRGAGRQEERAGMPVARGSAAGKKALAARLEGAKTETAALWNSTFSPIRTGGGPRNVESVALKRFIRDTAPMYPRLQQMYAAMMKPKGGAPQVEGFAREVAQAMRQLTSMSKSKMYTAEVKAEFARQAGLIEGFASRYQTQGWYTRRVVGAGITYRGANEIQIRR